jgi:hypothetical protein
MVCDELKVHLKVHISQIHNEKVHHNKVKFTLTNLLDSIIVSLQIEISEHKVHPH